MDNTYAPTENKEQEKIKVDSIDTIVTVRGDRPYYENMYREVGDNYYHIGYSSYRLDVALEYREKYFELVERESDWIPCNERMPKGTVLCCDDRGNILKAGMYLGRARKYINDDSYLDTKDQLKQLTELYQEKLKEYEVSTES